MKATDIYSYITSEEANFNLPITVSEGWDWNFKEHVNEGVIYFNSQITGNKFKGTIDEKPVKNIIRPIINLRFRAEDIDVKDIVIYVDDPDKYHLSLLIKKYHDDVFVVENDLDTYFDELKESKIVFGGGLSKNVNRAKPDIVNLQSIAFCDQTDILNGPIGIKHEYSPDKLKDMESVGWGKFGTTIDEVIALGSNEKTTQGGRKIPTPGRYIEVYEVHGMFPESWVKENGDENKFSRQLWIVTFYQNKDGGKQGITLFKGPEKENPFKFAQGEKIYGRALSFGGVEELVEDQIWTNYSKIREKELLDSASKTILASDDPTISAKHPTGLKGMDNLEIIETSSDKKGIWQIDTFPRNVQLFVNAEQDWWTHAQTQGFAHDPMLGIQAPSGTPFRSEVQQVAVGSSMHEYRMGKFAKHIEELYRDWFIPYMVKEITKGTKFLSELSLDELKSIAKNIAIKKTNDFIIKAILNGKDIDPQEIDALKEAFEKDFIKGGNKRFIEILKDDFKNAQIRVKINIKGKQKNLGLMADKMTNIFRAIFANPDGFIRVMQIPAAAKAFNQMIEYSGLSPADFGDFGDVQAAQAMQPTQTMQPVELPQNETIQQ